MDDFTPSARKHFVISAVLIAVTSFAVLLRFFLKFTRRQKLQGPDWMCLLSTGVFNISCGLVINYILNVSEYHAFDNDLKLGLAELMNLAKLVYVTEIMFGIGITSIKLSILWFFYILFSVDRTLRLAIRGAVGVCIVWFIIATSFVIFQCRPVDAYWKTFGSPQYCFRPARVLLGYETTNLFIDVAILGIPIRAVWQLQLPRSKKATVSGIFLLGGLVCVTSILRLTAIWHPADIKQYDFRLAFIYSGLQLGLAIITSCLPTYGPLLIYCSRLVPTLRSWYSALSSSARGSRQIDRHKASRPPCVERPWVGVGDDGLDATSQTWAYGGNYTESQFALQPIPSGTTLVNREVQV
ncbi:hypothetical protein GGS20DRAFT_535558 [Poronia punctata]|nr:hypothetical protein GGS20DRAFT_535558 [Poronia punctata]